MKLGVDLIGANTNLLEAMAGRAADVRPALTNLADVVRDRQHRVFATADSGRWAPLDPATVRSKGSSRVLVDTGGLLRSLTRRGDRYAVERVETDALVVGTKNPVAVLHRTGARGMPVRHPVPPLTSTDRAALADELLGFITGQR